MALTCPRTSLFEDGFIVLLTIVDLTGTRRGRLLCLELSNTLNIMTPPPVRSHYKLSSHVYRIQARHRLWRNRRLGSASDATGTCTEGTSEKATDLDSQIIDSLAAGNGADYTSRSEATALDHYEHCKYILRRIRASSHALSGLCQTHATSRRRQTVATNTAKS